MLTLLVPPMLLFCRESRDTASVSTCRAADRGGTEVNGDAKDESLCLKRDREGQERRALSMREAAARVDDEDDDDA
jgi:hypothetical protein